MNPFQKALHSARLIGVGNVYRSFRYAIQRARLDARYGPCRDPGLPRPIGRLLSAEAIESGARFTYERGELKVRFLTDDFIFLGWDGTAMAPSYAVVNQNWPVINPTLVQSGQDWRLSSQELELLASADGSLRYSLPSGEVLRQEGPPDRFEHGWQQEAHLPPEACIYGLGERSSRLDLRPGTYRFWNMDAGGHWSFGHDPLYICIPIYLCLQDSGSYLVFYDNTFEGDIRLDERATIRFRGGPARYYLAIGAPSIVLERLGELIGRAPLPPRWALGFQQSRWGYFTESEMHRVYGGFRQHHLPVSVLVMDADHMRGFRTLTTDTDRYPNLPQFVQELAQDNVHLVASVNPAIKVEPGFDLYENGLQQDVFTKTPSGKVFQGVVWPGWAAFPDFTNPCVREWWGKQYLRHTRQGIDGFWHDMNEPSCFAAYGEITLPRSVRHSLEGRGGDHLEAHNVYGLLMNQAGYDGLRKLRPDRRPFILSRSGWAGVQRSAWTWTGDVETSWQVLRQTIACVLGLGLSGVPYSGPDIGGFSGAPSPELFVRWFQLASFLPFFRAHCAFYLPRREPWAFGEKVLAILRQALELRYRLMPYWYTLAWQASQAGYPLVRPLFWDEPENPTSRQVDDAFLAGDALFVAPVVEEGARQRSVVLPGGEWYELSSDHSYPGSTEVVLDAPLESIPILVRAGAILPQTEGDCLWLHAYKPLHGKDGEGMLYSDAGDGYGPWRVDRFTLHPVDGGYELNWEARGEFEWPYPNVTLQLHGFHVEQTRIDIRPLQSIRIAEGGFAQ